MYAELTGASKVHSDVSIRGAFDFADAVIRGLGSVIDQLPRVEFTRRPCPAMKRGHDLQEFEAIWIFEDFHPLVRSGPFYTR